MSGQSGAAPGSNFLPNFCSLRSAFVVVVSAELLAVVLAFASDAPLAEFWPALALRSLYVQWVAVLATVLLCVLRRLLAARSDAAAGLIAWLVISLTAAAVALAAARLVPQAEPFDPATFVLRSVAVAAAVAALLLRYLYDQHQQRECQQLAGHQRHHRHHHAHPAKLGHALPYLRRETRIARFQFRHHRLGAVGLKELSRRPPEEFLSIIKRQIHRLTLSLAA